MTAMHSSPITVLPNTHRSGITRRGAPAVAVLALVIAACSSAVGSGGGGADGSQATRSPSATPSASPATASPGSAAPSLVARVESVGGFVAPGALLGRLPTVAVYDDGSVYTQGPQIMIYPGPLLPNIQVRRISDAALRRLIELARQKDLLRDARYELPLIADAPTTELTLVVDGRTYTQSAYALGEGTDLDAGLSDADRLARANLRAYIDALMNVPAAEVVRPDESYVPAAYRVFVGPEQAGADPNLVQQPLAWPLSDLASAGTPLANGGGAFQRCVTVVGDEAATVRPVFERANVLTPFVSGGARYSLIVRPLLPDESGC